MACQNGSVADPNRPLKKCHELLAHFGNSGMNKILLAGTLTLGGTTQFNIRMRWKAKVNKRELVVEIMDIPGDFVEIPEYYDHSYLDYLSELAENCGLSPILIFSVAMQAVTNSEP
jgi:hypothetical protein